MFAIMIVLDRRQGRAPGARSALPPLNKARRPRRPLRRPLRPAGGVGSAAVLSQGVGTPLGEGGEERHDKSETMSFVESVRKREQWAGGRLNP